MTDRAHFQRQALLFSCFTHEQNQKTHASLALFMSLLLLTSCHHLRSDVEAEDADKRPIGVATLEKDGALTVSLLAESTQSGQPIIGHSQTSYQPKAPEYQMYLRHLGGLKRGESKNIPPFSCDSPKS